MSIMTSRSVCTLASLAVCALLQNTSHAQVSIVFDYTYDGGFFSGVNAGRRSVLEAAAATFTGRLGDSLSAISPSGANHWDAIINNPSGAGTLTITDPVIASKTVKVYVGGEALGGSTLGQGGAGGYSASGTSAWLNNLVTRGQSGTFGTSSSDTDYAPWGGSLSFNSSASWYFDSDPSTVESFAGQSDFYSVAVHEIGHLLGVGQAPTWDNKISGTEFTGSQSVLCYGGNISLNTGQDHWASGTMSIVPSTGANQETSMDPSITIGTRKYFTDLDFAVLSDIGWEVSPVPEPQSVALATGCVLLVAATWLRKQRRAQAKVQA
jgi:hypothetical protein